MPSTRPTRRDWVLPTEAEQRQQAFWRMRPAERVAAMRRGELTLFECLRWASQAPQEVPMLNGEFEFIAVRMPEVADLEED